MFRQTTFQTMMPADGKFLFNPRAAGTGLTGISRIDFYQFSPGAFSLVRKHEQKRTPRSIVNLFREKPFTHSGDVQFFNRDNVVLMYQSGRKFMLGILPLIENRLVYFTKLGNRFSSAIRSFRSSRYFPLCDPKPLRRSFVEAPVRDVRSVRQRSERFDADINPNLFTGCGQRLFGNSVTRNNSEPLTALALQGDLFNLSLNRARKFNFQIADKGHIQTISVKAETLPVINNRVEKGLPFEARIARILSCFYSTEKRSERLVQPPKRSLKDASQHFLVVGIERIPNLGNLVDLVKATNADVIQAPSFSPFGKRGVVEIAQKIKRAFELFSLNVRGQDAVFE